MKAARRQPLLALAAALMLPGLGHVYAGDMVRGLLVLFGIALLPPATAWLGLLGPHRALWLVVLAGSFAGLALYAWSVVDAWRTVRRHPEQPASHGWQRPAAYLLCAIAAYFLVLVQFVGYAREHLLETFSAPTASMLPTIAPGDRFLADKRVNQPGGLALRRGDVALFIYPNQRTSIFVKRIIGLPGDTVELKGSDVMVNGRSIRGAEVHDLGDPSLNRLLADHVAFRELGDAGEHLVIWRKDRAEESSRIVVPNGQLFVLGDNRDASHDSRRFGPVPVADVKAVARQVVLSYAQGTGIRWSRFGKLIE